MRLGQGEGERERERESERERARGGREGGRDEGMEAGKGFCTAKASEALPMPTPPEPRKSTHEWQIRTTYTGFRV